MIPTLRPDGQEARPEAIATVVLIDGQVRLRIHQGERLELDLPIHWRRALLLGMDLITHGAGLKLRERRACSSDGPQLELPIENDVA
jgi:hypothetical protein